MRGGYGAGQVHDAGHTVGAAAGNRGDERCRAVRYVAGSARDAVDAALLLEALGLTAIEGRDGTEKVT